MIKVMVTHVTRMMMTASVYINNKLKKQKENILCLGGTRTHGFRMIVRSMWFHYNTRYNHAGNAAIMKYICDNQF